MSETERRHFSRVELQRPATLTGLGIEAEVEVLDVSLKGVLIALPAPARLTPDADYRLCLPLSAETEIRMDLRPAHRSEDRAGFHCTRIVVDSMSHLRRLVELNLGDATLLRRELAELSEG